MNAVNRALVRRNYYVILNSRNSQKSSSAAQIAAFLQGFLAMAERGVRTPGRSFGPYNGLANG